MRITFLLVVSFLGLVQLQTVQKTTNGSILFVTSNQETYGTTAKKTANHFAEIVYAYEEFVNAGYSVDFVSPNGGEIPVGYIKQSDSLQQKYVKNAVFMKLLQNTFKPSQINASNYKAVYYSGGGAAMFGVPENISIQTISRKIYQNKGVIKLVVSLINLKIKKHRILKHFRFPFKKKLPKMVEIFNIPNKVGTIL